jgi:hypothetical protein
MKYIVFPSYELKNDTIPALDELIIDSDIEITAGPTSSGLYLISGSEEAINHLKFLADPYYLFMEHFELVLM